MTTRSNWNLNEDRRARTCFRSFLPPPPRRVFFARSRRLGLALGFHSVVIPCVTSAPNALGTKTKTTRSAKAQHTHTHTHTHNDNQHKEPRYGDTGRMERRKKQNQAAKTKGSSKGATCSVNALVPPRTVVSVAVVLAPAVGEAGRRGGTMWKLRRSNPNFDDDPAAKPAYRKI